MIKSELIEMNALLEPDALQRWIDLGWVLPRSDNDTSYFDDSDVIRVRLICELHYELHIEEDNLSVVLSLMDQLYATRRSLRDILVAIQAQPNEVRTSIAELVSTQQPDRQNPSTRTDL
jgi:chaperone modulatory protein CbpM